MKLPKHLNNGKHLSLSICSALRVGGDNRQRVPCSSSGCSGKSGYWRFKCVEFSQAQVRSLDNLGNGMLGSICMSNGVKSPDSNLSATILESNDHYKSNVHNEKEERNVPRRYTLSSA